MARNVSLLPTTLANAAPSTCTVRPSAVCTTSRPSTSDSVATWKVPSRNRAVRPCGCPASPAFSRQNDTPTGRSPCMIGRDRTSAGSTGTQRAWSCSSPSTEARPDEKVSHRPSSTWVLHTSFFTE